MTVSRQMMGSTFIRNVALISGKPAPSFRLSCSGERLYEDRTLSGNGVEDGDTIHMMIEQVGGKPVIFLYPEQECNVSVKLKLCSSWNLTHLYPKGKKVDNQTVSWNVKASPDGSLTCLTSNEQLNYLFWEATTTKTMPSTFDPSLFPFHPFVKNRAFVVPIDSFDVEFNELLKKTGMNVRDRQDFITFWLERIFQENKNFIKIQIATQQEYELAAHLEIHPLPDTMFRVFACFQCVDDGMDVKLVSTSSIEEMSSMGIPILNSQRGFTVIEWGAMIVQDVNQVLDNPDR